MKKYREPFINYNYLYESFLDRPIFPYRTVQSILTFVIKDMDLRKQSCTGLFPFPLTSHSICWKVLQDCLPGTGWQSQDGLFKVILN